MGGMQCARPLKQYKQLEKLLWAEAELPICNQPP